MSCRHHLELAFHGIEYVRELLEFVSNLAHVRVLHVATDALQLMFCCMPAADRWVQNRHMVTEHKQRVMTAASHGSPVCSGLRCKLV